jgi:hypothetical protein
MDKATCDTTKTLPNRECRPLNFKFFGKFAARRSARRGEPTDKHSQRQRGGGKKQRPRVQAGRERNRKLSRGKRCEQKAAGPLAHSQPG